jgi:putative endonuclease
VATHNETGKKGEELGLTWLREQGYEVLHRNWRYLKSEIDIIALKNQVVHIVEVKTSRSLRYGFPEERVNKRKMQLLMKAGAHFLARNRQWRRIQYDILSICIDRSNTPTFLLIEDVYWSGL